MRKQIKMVLCLMLAALMLVGSMPAFAAATDATEKASKRPRINIEGPPDIEFDTGGIAYLYAAGEYDVWGYNGTVYADVYKGSKRIFRYKESVKDLGEEVGEWRIYIPLIKGKNEVSVLKANTKYKLKFYIKTKKGTSKKLSFSFRTEKKWW